MLPLVTPLVGSIGGAVLGGIKKLFGGRTLPKGAVGSPVASSTFPPGSHLDLGVQGDAHLILDKRNGKVYASISKGLYTMTGMDDVTKWWLTGGAEEQGQAAWLYRSDGARAGQKPAAQNLGGELVFDTSGLGFNPFTPSMLLLAGLAVGAVLLLTGAFRR